MLTLRLPRLIVAVALALAGATPSGANAAVVAAVGGIAPQHAIAFGAAGSAPTGVDADHPLPSSPTTLAGISTPCTGTITSSAAVSTAVTPTDPKLAAAYPACTASFSGGVGKLGPFVPQLGRPVRVITSQASPFTAAWWYVGTSIDGCTTVNRLTSDDTLKPDWTGQVNDYLDVPPTTGGVAYCIVGTITSGALAVAVRN